MSYWFKFKNDDREFSIHRSRYTGDWGLFEKNPYYGYYAARRYFGQRMTREHMLTAANIMGLDPETVIATAEVAVRAGVENCLLPDPDFTFTNGGSI